jgi:preprotein translocase SecE subunit
MDRYAYRDLHDRLMANYVRVTDGDAVRVMSRTDYEAKYGPQIQDRDRTQKEIERLKRDSEEVPAELQLELDRLNASLPAVSAPAAPTVVGRHRSLVMLPAVALTLPLLLLALTVWFAWRVVNVPAFADFLIATEAEMNKVSWASRKRLFQDTIVVLVTVVLVAAFLLVADMVWSQSLRRLGVLRFGSAPPERTAPGSEEVPW